MSLFFRLRFHAVQEILRDNFLQQSLHNNETVSCLLARPLLNTLGIGADSIKDKVVPMLEWLQMELRASPNEVSARLRWSAVS